MVAAGFGRALVIAGGTYRAVRNTNGVDDLVVAARVANTDGPEVAVHVAAAEIKIAARIDGKMSEGLKFARGEIDRHTLGNGAEIENQGAKQRDRFAVRVQGNVAIAHAAGLKRGPDGLAGSIFAVETARLHGVPNGWVKCAVTFPSDGQGKMNGFVQGRAGCHGSTDLSGEPHGFALGIKPRAGVLNAAKPGEGTLDGFFPMVRLE